MAYDPDFNRRVAEIQADTPYPPTELTEEQLDQWLSESDYANRFGD